MAAAVGLPSIRVLVGKPINTEFMMLSAELRRICAPAIYWGLYTAAPGFRMGPTSVMLENTAERCDTKYLAFTVPPNHSNESSPEYET
uniref:Uncharacterized protein n=1 Tax=Tanacetum cinerariifolium TaxID=118510 RepID=A0A699W4J6_TANCI|nr:hypothetical protein [Tanacetum cinerariifolium]